MVGRTVNQPLRLLFRRWRRCQTLRKVFNS